MLLSSSTFFFFFNDTATTEIYTLSLHDALPILIVGPHDAGNRSGEILQAKAGVAGVAVAGFLGVLKAQLGRSEEHTSELQSRRDLVCRLLLEKKKKYKIYVNDEYYTHITKALSP